MNSLKACKKILFPMLSLIKDFYRLQPFNGDIQFIVHTMH